MPTYQYRCQNDHEFEEFQSITDDAIETCPECGEKATRVISGGAGLIFKGSGFYITDYRKESYKKDAARDTGPGSKKKTTDSKTDSKKKAAKSSDAKKN